MKPSMQFINFILLPLVFSFFIYACESNRDAPVISVDPHSEEEIDTIFLRGADLSYVNEMKDCGAVYYDQEGEEKEPYQTFKAAKTDLIRLRLWHTPDWTEYSNFDDVKKAIAQVKALNMSVLLDFHYSDEWADPNKQLVPAAWSNVVYDTVLLGDSLYNYTFKILERLHIEDLLPEYVQIGNETNIEILQDPDGSYDIINWPRNAALINRGLQAVNDASAAFKKEIGTFLHVAQPENAVWWFEEATQNGVTDYDWIGISYYPKWSNYSLSELPSVIHQLTQTYKKQLMVVETAYPFTLTNNDPANNILGQDAAIPGYNISPEGQYNYLKDLESKIIEGGGSGLIYWEPAWVSTSCTTLWGQGSHWDNATLFDHRNQALLGLRYFSGE